MRHCVLFSVYCPDTPVALEVLRYHLNILQEYHKDSLIIFGANSGISASGVNLIKESGLNFRLSTTPDHLSINSDAAGYMTALRELRAVNEQHDIYWFGHTKGASQPTFSQYSGVRYTMLRNVWEKKPLAEALFSAGRYGVMGDHMILHSREAETVDLMRFKKISRLPLQPIGFTIFQTHYAMRGDIIQKFLECCEVDFFEKNIVDDLKFNRFFFETIFPNIACMCGYEPRPVAFDMDDTSLAIMDGYSDRTSREHCHGALLSHLLEWREDKSSRLPQVVEMTCGKKQAAEKDLCLDGL